MLNQMQTVTGCIIVIETACRVWFVTVDLKIYFDCTLCHLMCRILHVIYSEFYLAIYVELLSSVGITSSPNIFEWFQFSHYCCSLLLPWPSVV